MNDQTYVSLAARFLQGVGLADISVADLRTRSSISKHEPQAWSLASAAREYRVALEFLSSLTFPATRHVVFATQSGSAAMVNNGRDGSDYGDYTYLLPRRLRCRFARTMNGASRVWTKGALREVLQYESRIFALHGPDGKPVRVVHCFDDGGRWDFTTVGEPHPIEATFPYGARRKSDRFSEQNLRDLAAAFNLPLPATVDFLNAGNYLLYEEHPGHSVLRCSIEEADDPAYGYYLRGMGYAEHMDTHFKSVVQDLEKCLTLNASYAPRVQAYLDEARRRLATNGR